MEEHDIQVSGHRVGIALAPESFPDVLLKWCFEASQGDGQEYTMIYVQGPLRMIPTPVGRIPVSQVSQPKLDEFMSLQQKETKEFEEKMQRVCDFYKVKATFLVVESDQVGKALVEQIEKLQLSSFIVGHRRSMVRMRAGVSDYVLNHAPSYCAVHCVSKASRLVSFRERNSSSPKKAGKKLRRLFGGALDSLPRSSTCSDWSLDCMITQEELLGPSHDPEVLVPLTPELVEPRTPQMNEHEELLLSCEASPSSDTDFREQHRTEEAGITTDSELLEMLKLQLESAKLEAEKANDVARRELARSREAEAQTLRALAQVTEMNLRVSEETKRREAAVMAAEMEKRKLQEECDKHAQALRLAGTIHRAFEEEIKAKEAETKRLMEQLAYMEESSHTQAETSWKGRCTEFSYNELKLMTNSFAESNRLGEGGYGAVYKGQYYHTDVAVKALNRNGLQGAEEFTLEMKVLSRLHHPHVVLLLGGCSEHGCLVYEYMENGSLEDRLACSNNSPPIPCYTRYRIAVDTAKALMFLHKARPQPIIHRDLKPANILLDMNFRAKIGDVGCARLMAPGRVSSVNTSPVGTFAYIDPEYQREGSLSPKSDVYSFGIVLLRLLTALTPIGIATSVSAALERGSLLHLLDERAGAWPVAAAMQLAYIGLGCAEPERKNRLELERVLDMLVKMESMFESEQEALRSHARRGGAPSLYMCPILQEVMEYPVIAADGYTYEHEAIRLWLEGRNTSPMTNLPMENKNLIANRLMRSAICEWRASNC